MVLRTVVQRGDLVVELFAAFVEATSAVGQDLQQGVRGDLAAFVLRQFGRDLQQGQRAADVAVGGGGDFQQGFVRDAQRFVAQAALAIFQRALQRGADVLRRDRFHHVHAAARQQCRVQFERGVFGGGADKQDGAALDVRQESVLLGLVEAVHFVDEQHGAAAAGEALRRFGKHRSHFRQAGKHGRDGLEFGVGVVRQQRNASVVLPQPGGPHRIIECTCPDSTARRSALPGASRRRWPTISSRVRGRMRSASGRRWSWSTLSRSGAGSVGVLVRATASFYRACLRCWLQHRTMDAAPHSAQAMNHHDSLAHFSHDHDFLGERHERNARRTWAVVGLTAVMMIVEIVAGVWTGSMALLADGIHMSTHAGALAIAGFAYAYARRHRDDRRFTFGTGKVGDLAGVFQRAAARVDRPGHRGRVSDAPGPAGHDRVQRGDLGGFARPAGEPGQRLDAGP